MFVCIHSRRLGPAGGGTRMKVYESPADALRDGTRLAAGMTAKFAVAGLPFGGGKAVLAVPRLPDGEERRELLHRYGALVCSLGGNYLTGCDMNTTPADLDVIAEVCPHVFGAQRRLGRAGAVHCARRLPRDPRERRPRARLAGARRATVLVQGVGQRRRPARCGCWPRTVRSVLVTDVDTARAEAAGGAQLGARAVGTGDSARRNRRATSTRRARPAARSRRRRSRACAAASSPAPRTTSSASPADAERLRDRGILYAPDFVINAGGVFHNVGRESLGWGDAEVEQALAGIGGTLGTIYERSEAGDVSTGPVALDLAAERLLAEPR